jgi:arsenite transporter
VTTEKAYKLTFFHKYLTLWLALCIAIGIGLGSALPGLAELLNSLAIAQVNIPIAILLCHDVSHYVED